MFADFNYLNVPYSERVKTGVMELSFVPRNTMLAIGEFVRTLFTAMAAAITFGQVELFNRETVFAIKGTISNAVQAALGILAILIPMNVSIWNRQVQSWETR